MPFIDIESIPQQELLPGCRIRAPYGQNIMLSYLEMDEGAIVPMHQHPHEQAGMLLQGTMALTIGTETRLCQPGSMYIIPPNTQHQAVAVGGPCLVLDIFNPVREDYAALFNRYIPEAKSVELTPKTAPEDVVSTRQQLRQRLFPRGVPRLWCPTLTHYAGAADPDADRMTRHLRHLSPWVQGILVPGSTGEGWDMSDSDIRWLLEIVLKAARENGTHVLLGILKTDTANVLQALDNLRSFLDDPAVVGITVCPPQGSDKTQQEIRDGLRQVLDRGLPTALYQLPQVTQNEMAPETVRSLADEYPNFLLFKDTSGADRVAQSVQLPGIFLVRGAEVGGYARWPRTAGGNYDGFLLSTANVFAPQLTEVLNHLDAGNVADAQRLSAQLESVVQQVFQLVGPLKFGNPFANANKLLDHLMAYGEQASSVPMPMLYHGERLPVELLAPARELLIREGWFGPGYLT